jgi:predicted ATPase with chaperone activity
MPEMLEVSMIASVAGAISNGRLTQRRPFRAPHHSASMAAMVGGGIRARPGEVSLAHNGVLFLALLPQSRAGSAPARLREHRRSGHRGARAATR